MPFVCRPLPSTSKTRTEAQARQIFTEMAKTWNRLAAEMEADQTLFQAISEMELGEPYDALPNALRLRLGEYA